MVLGPRDAPFRLTNAASGCCLHQTSLARHILVGISGLYSPAHSSGRPLACASLGGLPTFSALSIADVLHLPTLDHISSGPPKIPYVRFYRGREQACACPPAQIPACALTHGAPTSDDDERPLVKPRALKPVAVTRETPTQGRHRKCVLHYLNRQCRVVVSTDRLGVDP